jgi:hypothetical protein
VVKGGGSMGGEGRVMRREAKGRGPGRGEGKVMWEFRCVVLIMTVVLRDGSVDSSGGGE